jgi:DNA ligase D-like protein (predicted ligase)
VEASTLPDPSTQPIRPMLATEGAIPVGSAWAFEFVWDGLRALAYIQPDRVRLLSGTGRLVTASYPELAALSALADKHGPLVLDGKIVAFDQFGRPSVAPLRQRMSGAKPSPTLLRRTPVQFYLFDVLYLRGRSTRELTYRERRELLPELDLTGLPAQLPPYFLDTDGQTVLHAAERHGLAGVVAKRLDSRYLPGRRSRAWVETLPRHTQRVVIGGWLPAGRGEDPDRVGALLVGVPGAGGLRYVGRVSTGLDGPARRALADRFAGLGQRDCPFHETPPEAGVDARWLAPKLVGEISYRRWEADGRLRTASWLGLCPDVHPASVRAPMTLTSATNPAPNAVSDTVPDTVPSTVVPPPAAGPGEAPSSAPAADLAALTEAVRLAQAETRSLRAQISPHFVYNALTTIASYVRTDPPRARELLLEFAEYTRYSFRTGAESTTLGAELANADRYLTLESARFGDRLRVKRQVDEAVLDVPLPFLTVQPLVENAVRYGIEGTPRGGTVSITAAEAGEECVVTVSDDGLGMDPARLTDAVTDVRDRLRAAPGPVATLRVDTAPETGTTITLRLPRSAGRLAP